MAHKATISYVLLGLSILTVALHSCGRNANVVAPPNETTIESREKLISTGRDTLAIPKYATAIFPDSAFLGATSVTLSVAQTPATDLDYDMARLVFDAGPSMQFYVQLETEGDFPWKDLEIITVLTDQFISAMPANHQPAAFIRLVEKGGAEVLDNYELVYSEYTSATKLLRIAVPYWAFDDSSDPDHTFKATFKIGSMKDYGGGMIKRGPALVDPTCPIALVPPLDGQLTIVNGGEFMTPRKRDSPKKAPYHLGVDLKASDNPPVRAMHRGKVKTADYGENKSYGKLVIIEHLDESDKPTGFVTYYAHLKDWTIEDGAIVEPRDIIGYADNTGASSGDHLHIELRNLRQLGPIAQYYNPTICIDETVKDFLEITSSTMYHVFDGAIVRNGNVTLTRLIHMWPLAQSDIYQEVTNVDARGAEILDIPDTEDKYLHFVVPTDELPADGENKQWGYTFDVVLHGIKAHLEKITTIYPYNTSSAIYQGYTGSSGPIVDPSNTDIEALGDLLWSTSSENLLTYARLCYEHVAANFFYSNEYAKLRPVSEVLAAGGGHSGDLSSIFVSLLRYKGIPSRHIVTVTPNHSYHVFADFYMENYGWIPVDVANKAQNPSGDYFGSSDGSGIVFTKEVWLLLQRRNSADTYYTSSIQTGEWHWWGTWPQGSEALISDNHVMTCY